MPAPCENIDAKEKGTRRHTAERRWQFERRQAGERICRLLKSSTKLFSELLDLLRLPRREMHMLYAAVHICEILVHGIT